MIRPAHLFAVVFGFTCLAATTAQAADLEIKKVEVASQTGNTASVKVFGSKTGAGPNRQTIKAYWVTGANRREIYSGVGQFDGSASGFSNTIQIELPADTGNLEFEAVNAERDPTPPNNKKPLRVGGSDLSFDSAVINEKAGAAANANRELVVTIANNGPAALAAGCRLIIAVTERAAAREVAVNIPALPRRAKFQKKVAFGFTRSNNAAHNKVRSRVECAADAITNNNIQDMQLR